MAEEDGAGLEPTEIVPPHRTIAEKYQLGRLIGEGGMGTVYEAEHTGLGVRVAIKLLGEAFAEDQTFVRRFRREARAAAAVRHENVVAVTDTGTDDDGIPFLVMELLDGESLGSILRRERVLSPETACNVARQVLRGLGAAHRQGVIHRDLKPANVFLAQIADGSQKAKILDFGISKFAMEISNVTAEGAVIGTPSYMAPEQVKGSADVDHRSDLYAVGVMIYRMTTGKLPFGGKKSRQIYDRILAGNPIRPREIRSTIPEALEEVVLKAVALDPDDRFPDADAMVGALKEAVPNLENTDPVPLITRSSVIPSLAPATNPGLAKTIPSRASRADRADTDDENGEPKPTDDPGPTRRGRGSRPITPDPGDASSDAETNPRSSIMDSIASERGRGWTGLLALTAAAAGIVGVVAWADSDEDPDTDVVTEETTALPAGSPLVYTINRYADEADVRAQHLPVVDYLSERLERRVELSVVEDYELVDLVDAEEPHLVGLSAHRYVDARERHPDLRLVATASSAGGSSYQGVIVSLAGSGIESLEDLRSKVFCYVSRTSTSGYLYPRHTLREAGLDPDDAFQQVQFTRDHSSSLRMLKRGECDAAAVYQGAISESEYTPQEFNLIASTVRVPHDAYVLAGDADDTLFDALRSALLALERDSDLAREVLGDGSIRGFVPALDTDYDEVRTVIRAEDQARRDREEGPSTPEGADGETEETEPSTGGDSPDPTSPSDPG